MVSGRGQFFVPPIERTADDVVTLSYVLFFSVRERGRFLPTSSPRLVLMMFYIFSLCCVRFCALTFTGLNISM